MKTFISICREAKIRGRFGFDWINDQLTKYVFYSNQLKETYNKIDALIEKATKK